MAHELALSCGQLQHRLAQAGTLEDIVKKGDGVMTESCKKLELAFEKTADWIYDLQERYPNDRQVERIGREITTWDRALRKVRKVR